MSKPKEGGMEDALINHTRDSNPDLDLPELDLFKNYKQSKDADEDEITTAKSIFDEIVEESENDN